MKIKQHKILGERLFQEVTIPQKVFKLKKGVVAVYHSYYGQWSGRHQEIAKKSITLFDQNGHTIAHLNSLRYPLNDLDYDPIKQEVVIATGSYDGGAMFEGELLQWDLRNNNVEKIIKDNREFIHCKFENDVIKIKVNPTDDLWTEELKIISYKLQRGLKPQEIKDLTEIHSEEFEWESKKENPLEELQRIGQNLDNSFNPHTIIWDIKMSGESVISGHSFGKILIQSINNNEKKSIQVRENGDCVQLFLNRVKNTIIVNTSFRGVDEVNPNIAYEIELTQFESKEKIKGHFNLSINKSGNFLARQTNHNYGKETDKIYNSQFQLLKELDLGHYDLFNHYIRIDNEKEFYALIGEPKNQHKLKGIHKIKEDSLEQQRIFAIENDNPHLMEPNFLKTNNGFLVHGKIYNPNPRSKSHIISSYNNSGILNWTKETEGNAIELKYINGDYFLMITNKGEMNVRRVSDGETKINLNEFSKVKNCKPLCCDSYEGAIAVGYDNGLIEIFKIEE